MYGDCCRSSPYFVPEQQRLGASAFNCMTLFDTTIYVMTKCPPEWKDPDTRNRCEHPSTIYSDPLLDAPVTSYSTSITYRNWHCASCHRDLDANTAVIWGAEFKCYHYVPAYESAETLAEQLSYNPLTLQWNFNRSKYTYDTELNLPTAGHTEVSKSNSISKKLVDCDITFRAPSIELQERRGCKFGIIDRCSENWEDNEAKSQCEAYTARTYSGNNLYRNHHCLLCTILAVPSTTVSNVLHQPRLSFTMLLDWRRLNEGVCSSSEIYDPLSRVCRKVFIS
jgi:hypothetical protein